MDVKKSQYISDLNVGTRVSTIFVLARKQIKKKKNGEDYCVVSFQDREGDIDGVLWTEVYKYAGDFNQGDFVLVEGEVKEYKDSRQLVVSSLKKIEDKENLEYSDYIKTTSKNIDEMFSELMKYTSRIKNPFFGKLIDLFFDDKEFVEDFRNSTAAVKYHHAFRGGLLEHTLSITKICDSLSRIYHNLNYDLLVCGAVLHDVGKIREYKTVVNTEVTDEGKLLGHITIGYGMVLEKIKQIKGFPDDLKNRLLHIIVSHHGYKEFGSPRRPKILEAFVIFHLDYLDADIGGYNIILNENKSGADWSDYAKNFEGSVFLKELESGEDENGMYVKESLDSDAGNKDDEDVDEDEQDPKQGQQQEGLF
jgi:3'-5' exoribonuclease